MLTCPLCDKVCSSPSLLDFHTMSHTKEKPYKCLTCSAAFGLKDNLSKHIKAVHDGIKRIKTNTMNFKCPECSYACSGSSILRLHMRKHSVEAPFACGVPGCSFKTKYEEYLPGHVSRVHGNNDERPYECSMAGCNYKARDLRGLQDHLKIHTDERSFFCLSPGCSYTTKTKKCLRSHMYNIHSDKAPFKCSTCEFQTKCKSRLRQHEDEHKNIKRFPCTATGCSYATSDKKTLRIHFDGRHREKTVMCTHPGCNCKYGSTELLQRHLKKHKHPILMCPDDYCNFSTRYSHVLRTHVTRRHTDGHFVKLVSPGQSHRPKIEPTDQVDLFVCPTPNCNYLTEFQHRYDLHIMAHGEEKRKYSCKFCSLKFKCRGSLRVHVRRHICEKPYRCSQCNYTSVISSRLKSHAQNSHAIFITARDKPLICVKQCQMCKFSSSSTNEFVLHSMSHLKVAVALQRLNVNFI